MMAFAKFSKDAMLSHTKGKAVVSNVNNVLRESKIFPDDHGFMDRLACMESNNGLDSGTYREGYYGGIYQVDKIGFEDTQNVTSHPRLSDKFKKIKEEFGINWPLVKWEDLTTPAYSGIASRLFLSNIPESIPTDPEKQGHYWKKYYNTKSGKGNACDFHRKHCKGSNCVLMNVI